MQDPQSNPDLEPTPDEDRIADDADSSETPQDSLEAALAERNAYEERWLRSQAELDNYRRRVQKEMEEARLYQESRVIRDLLPGLDNLERAVVAAESSGGAEELVTGVRMVLKQFEDVLTAHAVQPISCVGEPFDPNQHEAIQQVPSADHPPMTVLQEVERGYRLHDRVLRPSKVIVSSNPAG